MIDALKIFFFFFFDEISNPLRIYTK